MKHRPAQRGITMLEMLIVLAIVGLMSGIAWPAAMSALDGIRLRSAADSMASLLAQAALGVERRQQPVEVVVDREKGLVSIVGVAAANRRELQLDQGITITEVEPALHADASDDREAEQPEERRFVLLPGAGWPAIRIELATSRGARRVVQLDPITGAPDVRVPEPGERK